MGAFLISALNKPKNSYELGYPMHTTLDVFEFFKNNLKNFFKPNPTVVDKKTGRPVPIKAKLMGEPLYQNKSLKKLLEVYFFENKINLLVN